MLCCFQDEIARHRRYPSLLPKSVCLSLRRTVRDDEKVSLQLLSAVKKFAGSVIRHGIMNHVCSVCRNCHTKGVVLECAGEHSDLRSSFGKMLGAVCNIHKFMAFYNAFLVNLCDIMQYILPSTSDKSKTVCRFVRLLVRPSIFVLI